MNGNMGQRYTAVLRHLGHEPWGFDIPGLDEKHELASQVRSEAEHSDAVIIATPTATHGKLLGILLPTERPILCEKPISKNLSELEWALGFAKLHKASLQMVSQYDYLVDDGFEGETVYDYFKSGGDGLYWDTINIIKHARGKVRVANQSPVWTCQINGQKLNLGLMDRAYIEMVAAWLKRPPTRTDSDGIWAAHKKVHDMEARAKWRLS
jgi:hypothetical protein